MIVFALSGLFIGAVLGTRFTMCALLPAMTFGVIVGAVSTISEGAGFVAIIEELVLLFAGLQIGYVCGAAVGYSTRSIQASRHVPASK